MLLHTVCLVTVLMVTYGFPAQNYQDTDVDEIATKLVRLKELLEKLDIHRKADTGMSTTSDDVKEPMESRDRLKSLMRDKQYNDVDKENSRTQQMKHFIDSLNEEDLNRLKLFRNIADKDISSSRISNTNEDVSSTDTENKQASSLHQQLNAIIQEEKKPGKIPAVTMKGKFLPSREEIKYAVEKNLMSDVALALHSGITINDLLKDLIGQTEDSKMAAVTSQGEWLDTHE